MKLINLLDKIYESSNHEFNILLGDNVGWQWTHSNNISDMKNASKSWFIDGILSGRYKIVKYAKK